MTITRICPLLYGKKDNGTLFSSIGLKLRKIWFLSLPWLRLSEPTIQRECWEDECAWYDEQKRECAVLVVAQALKGQIKVSCAR